MYSRFGLVGFVLIASIQAASADVVVSLNDNFTTTTSETPALNWTGDGIFRPIPTSPTNGQPSVDLVTANSTFSNAYYPNLTPNATNAPAAIQGLNAVDMDGTTGSGFSPAGVLQSVNELAAGSYVVNFYLAGNLRGAPGQEVEVSLGGKTQVLNPNPIPSDQDYTFYSLIFSDVAQGNLTFTDMGTADQQGTLLADVAVTAAVPETSTWAMMILGFLGLGFMAYRKQKQSFRAA